LLPLVAGVAVAEVVDATVAGAVAEVVDATVAGAVAEVVDATVAGVAAAASGPRAQIKWPNDVLVDGRKVAGILVEARLQEGWAVVGIGVNVAVRVEDFPQELRDRAGTLGLEPTAIEPWLEALLGSLSGWLGAGSEAVLEAVRARDALLGKEVRWREGAGVGAGIDDSGRLVVRSGSGEVALDAGEVHLGPA
jgi:BirA family transcriptional regulator, biotin operon repressor / biotin---[acetyl-CoA-carboxylase] ligase